VEDLTWATIIPLIGGSAIGCFEATKKKPEYHLSYSAFNKNEEHLTSYWKDVPRVVLDEGNLIPNKQIDFVNSVCPCAGLSQLNQSQDRNVRESRNYWMYEAAKRVLGEVQPRVYWGENAPALFTKSGEYVREKLWLIAKQYGYSFSLYRTSTFKHGIPQKRLRTFYFFWKSDTPPILNWYDRECKNLKEYLDEVPQGCTHDDEHNIKNIFEEYPSYGFLLNKHNLSHEDFIQKFKINDSLHTAIRKHNMFDECIEWLKENHQDSKELKKLKHAKDKILAGKSFMDCSPTFFSGDYSNAIVGRTLNSMVHPKECRGMSYRELMHMMGLPFDFNLQSDNLNHLAQNVPTCTARDMTLEVLKFLNNELQYHHEPFLKQDNVKRKLSTPTVLPSLPLAYQ